MTGPKYLKLNQGVWGAEARAAVTARGAWELRGRRHSGALRCRLAGWGGGAAALASVSAPSGRGTDGVAASEGGRSSTMPRHVDAGNVLPELPRSSATWESR